MHNFLKEVFNPILVSAYKLDNNVGIYVVNDKNTSITGTVNIEFVMWKNGETTVKQQVAFNVEGLEAKEVFGMDIDKFLGGKAKQTEGIIFVKAVGKDGTTVMSENWLLPVSPSSVTLVKAAINVEKINQVAPNIVDVTIRSPAVSPFVYLQSSGVVGKFEDNGMVLRPGISKIVRFIGRKSFDVKTFTDGLTVRSLADTY